MSRNTVRLGLTAVVIIVIAGTLAAVAMTTDGDERIQQDAGTEASTGIGAETADEPAATAHTRLPRHERTQRRRIGNDPEAADAEDQGRPENDAAPRGEPLRLETLIVEEDTTRRLPSDRDIHVGGDIRIEGTLDAAHATLVLDGGNQIVAGSVHARKFVLRGGTKRIRGRVTTSQRDPSEPGDAALYVEAGTTLLVEPDATFDVRNPYGFQVAGHVVVDGGTFACRFSNGNGKDRGEYSWLPGSSLTIHSGLFHQRGDADFGGATITLYDGEVRVDDDIWSTGETLNVYGGMIRNSTGGGAFAIKGALNMSAGELRVHQRAERGLQFAQGARIASSGGRVVIAGRSASGDRGGIYLHGSVALHRLDIEANTRIRPDSPDSAHLLISGSLHIKKGHNLDVRGRSIDVRYENGEGVGILVTE